MYLKSCHEATKGGSASLALSILIFLHSFSLTVGPLKREREERLHCQKRKK